MSSVEQRRTALANRLHVGAEELQIPAADSAIGAPFQLQPGGVYWVYSPDEEKQAFKSRVPEVPFLSQIADDAGQTYNVYLAVEKACTG